MDSVKFAGIKLPNEAGLIIIIILVGSIIFDSILLRTYDLFSKSSTSVWTIPIFVFMVSISILAQFILLEILRKKDAKIRTKIGIRFTRLHLGILLVQVILAVNLLVMVASILNRSSYSTMFLVIGTSVSYAATIAILVSLILRFIWWFRSRRNIELLLYGISAASIAISATLTLLFSDLTLSDLPTNVKFRLGGTSIYIPPGSIEEKLAQANYLFVPISFFLTWLSTATLLRSYARKYGNGRYWIIISIPLLVFMSQYVIQVFRISDQLIMTDAVFFGSVFTLLFIFTKLAGGILFGMAFWLISRKIENGRVVREYLIISSYGYLLLLLSIQILGIIVVPFPPFGILTISIAGLSSYLVFIGIYGSAITMTENSKLRSELRRTISESRFLDSIGSAQLEKEIEKEVVAVSKNFKDKLLKETGIDLPMEEIDVKDYVKEVLKEIKKK